jgi:hypothetical protein
MSDDAEISYMHAVYDKEKSEFARGEYGHIVYTKKIP